MLRKITVKQKIYSLAVMGVLLAVGITIGSIYSVNAVGVQLKQISTEDIPLTNAVTNVTVHQLEQAVLFERAARFAEVMYYNTDKLGTGYRGLIKNYNETKKHFFELAKKVDKEILDAEAKTKHVIEYEESHGGAEETIAEFHHVLDILKRVKSEHASFDKHVAETFALFEAGNVAAAEKMAEKVEEEEDKLAHELETLLVELEKFTADSTEYASHLEERLLQILSASAGIAALIFAVLSYVLGRSITMPLLATKNYADELANGNLEIDQPKHSFKDEIADMIASLSVFKENAIEAQYARQEQEAQKIKAERQQKEAMLAMADNFEAGVGGMISSLAAASTELQSTAEGMKDISDQTEMASQTVASSSEESSASVNSVASAMEEMSASSSEIASQVSMTTTRSNDTAENAKRANETVDQLDTLVQNIGVVVESIQDIAEQTNLLALNATIEAARAGEAGKGFAVVADEVKKLANETGQKTEEISSQIGAIQTATGASVEAMQRIISNISEIDVSVSGVSAAIEEQNATTSEISRSIAEASQGAQQVSQIIGDVLRGAQETGTSADNVLEASTEVSQLSEKLKMSVDEFLDRVRSDNAQDAKPEAAKANDDAEADEEIQEAAE